jgi:hypothetical protein
VSKAWDEFAVWVWRGGRGGRGGELVNQRCFSEILIDCSNEHGTMNRHVTVDANFWRLCESAFSLLSPAKFGRASSASIYYPDIRDCAFTLKRMLMTRISGHKGQPRVVRNHWCLNFRLSQLMKHFGWQYNISGQKL